MKLTDWFLSIIELVLWYGFFYHLLDAINNPSNLYLSALILTIISTAAILICPWFRNTDAWKRMTGKKE